MDRNNPLSVSREEDTTKCLTNTQQERKNECIQQTNKKLHAMTWHNNTPHKSQNING